MKKKMLCAALVAGLSLLVSTSFAIGTDDYLKIPANTKKAEIASTALYVVDVDDPTLYDWSSSNPSVLQVDNETGVFALWTTSGKETLTGTPKNGEGETIKIALSTDTPYFSSKNIVVDSPDGAILIENLDNGFWMVGTTGDDCFSCEKIDERKYGISQAYLIMPKKEGKGAIVYTHNMNKQYKINITVKKSALMSVEERQALFEKAGENAQIAVAKKGVNIRADASSDSEKVGSVSAGDELIVIQAYYTDRWHQILYNDEICYVSANYVNIVNNDK